MLLIGPGIFLLAFFAISAVGVVFWILKIVEVVGIPDHQFRAAHTEKVTWVLVVALAGWIGALIWQLAKRREVLAITGVLPPAPPGWYPEPGTAFMRWWDGTRWTEHRNAPPTG